MLLRSYAGSPGANGNRVRASLTVEAYRAIEPTLPEGTAHPALDDHCMVNFWIDQRVVGAIEQARFENEDLSDVIMRLTKRNRKRMRSSVSNHGD
jgi:hypothetical protein